MGSEAMEMTAGTLRFSISTLPPLGATVRTVSEGSKCT